VAKPIVLIAEELSPATVEALGPDFDVRTVDGTDRPALLAALADASAVLIRSATQVDAEAIAAATGLKVISAPMRPRPASWSSTRRPPTSSRPPSSPSDTS
jgi:D-3-phosphoglycerate dehydrogenase